MTRETNPMYTGPIAKDCISKITDILKGIELEQRITIPNAYEEPSCVASVPGDHTLRCMYLQRNAR